MIKMGIHVQPVPNWLFNVEIKAVMYYNYILTEKFKNLSFKGTRIYEVILNNYT